MCACACTYVCVCVCVRVRARVCVRVCACVRISTAKIFVQGYIALRCNASLQSDLDVRRQKRIIVFRPKPLKLFAFNASHCRSFGSLEFIVRQAVGWSRSHSLVDSVNPSGRSVHSVAPSIGRSLIRSV